MKKLFTLSVLLAFAFFCSAQSEVENLEADLNEKIRRPNIVKINSLALPFSNFSLAYERGLKPRLSVGLGLGYKTAGKEPTLFTVNSSVMSVNMDKIRGVSITPHARYYLRTCDRLTLEGFYAGVYLRYTRYWTSAQFDYFPEDLPSESYKAELALRELGVGIEMGYQLLIKERFSIDFLFFGPRFTAYQFNYEFTNPPGQAFLNDLSDYFNEVIDRFGYDYEVEIKSEGESSGSTSFGFANMRFGLSLGFAF